jgi:hypothetical protein
MSLAGKLQIPKGRKIRIINQPPVFKLDAPVAEDSQDAILLFARDSKVLKSTGEPVFEAARSDRLAWIAYPKGAQLGTDLNRDILWKLVEPEGIQPVRQISIDDVWSALRFRPAK